MFGEYSVSKKFLIIIYIFCSIINKITR